MTGEQKFVKLAQTILVVAGCVLIVMPAPIFPAYFKPKLMGLICFLYCFFIQLPVLLFRITDATPDAKRRSFLRTQVQAALSVGLLSAGLGSLGLWGLYKVGISYDKFIHFSFPGMFMISAVYFLQAWYGWSFKRTILFVGLIVGFSGVIWEFIEFGFDRWLHLGFFGHLFDHDSLFDILTNLLGVSTGSAVILWQQWLQKRLK